jgi:hypothetical protein
VALSAHDQFWVVLGLTASVFFIVYGAIILGRGIRMIRRAGE